jgi:hypothetical protein
MLKIVMTDKNLLFKGINCFIYAWLLVLIGCTGTTVKKVTVNETPPDGSFLLQQTNIGILQADFDSAVYIDKIGYPRIDFNKFSVDNQGQVLKSYKAVILENKYIKLTLIPGKGKPYSMIYKVTGHEEFYIPIVAQMHKSQNLGWWFMLGGVEYTLPNDEHGDTWAADWKWQIIENSQERKTVRMSVVELRHGLEESIDISIFPDKAYYETSVNVKNPTDSIIHFQHWINPMWVPGGKRDGLTPNTEFIIPAKEVYVTEADFNNWMLSYSAEGKRIQSYENSPLRFFKNWKYHGDLLALKLDNGFYSAFCHEENEGIVRVFPLESNPGCNIWTWGYEPATKEKILFSGSDKHSGYVEMWGGITAGFKKYHSLDPGKSISWSECMYPYANTKGLHYANNDFAVTFLKTEKGFYEVNLCPSGDLKGIELKVISIPGKNVYLDVNIESIFPKKDIAGYILNAKDKDIELVIYKDGKEIVRLNPKEPLL